jgi:hypothetical protein
MRSDNQSLKTIDTRTWESFERSDRKTSEKIEDNPIYENKYKKYVILISLSYRQRLYLILYFLVKYLIYSFIFEY